MLVRLHACTLPFRWGWLARASRAIVLIEEVTAVPDPGIVWAAILWTEPHSLGQIEVVVCCFHPGTWDAVFVDSIFNFKCFIIKDKLKFCHCFLLLLCILQYPICKLMSSATYCRMLASLQACALERFAKRGVWLGEPGRRNSGSC